MHDSVQKRSDTLCHLEKLEHPGNPEHPHHPDDGGVDGELLALYLLKRDAYERQDHYGDVQLVPS